MKNIREIKQDRRILQSLVETYGKNDVLKYIRSLNESANPDPDDFLCPANAWPCEQITRDKLKWYMNALSIDLDSKFDPIGCEYSDETADIEDDFLAEDCLCFIHNTVAREVIPARLRRKIKFDESVYVGNHIDVLRLLELNGVSILARGKETCIICYNDLSDGLDDVLQYIFASDFR